MIIRANFTIAAADAAIRALARGEFSFDDYERRVAWSALGQRLQFKRAVAQIAYGNPGDWFYRLMWNVWRVIFGE